MAKAVLVVQRRPGSVQGFAAAVQCLGELLTPDNIRAPKPLITHADGAAAAIFHPGRMAEAQGCSIRIGAVLGDAAGWDEPGAEPPEGTYAIVRTNRRCVELLADPVGSRTLWYTLTPERFIVSTSQRAVVTLLGSFELNEEAIPWMLSTGALGPAGGWDGRVQRVLPNERVTLDRSRWRIDTRIGAVSYRRDDKLSRREHAQRVSETLDDVGRAIGFESSKWITPLTGGVDSRGLLTAFLRAGRDVRTITWGLSAAQSRRYDDANIARKVAEHFGVPNRYFPVNLSPEPREKLLERFLVAGEGCVEAIPPFVDGFATWKTLHEEGVEGILRGDQTFGSAFVYSAREARMYSNLMLLSDFIPPDELATFELAEQKIPQRLEQLAGESLESWRDRLYEQHRISAFLAGLTSLESAYVEVVNPLLFGRVLECARRLPDDLRTGKRLWRQVVRSRSSTIPFARRPAVLPLQNFVNDSATLQLLLDEIDSQHASGILSRPLRQKILQSLHDMLQTKEARRPKQSARQVVTHSIPFGVRKLVRRYLPAKRPLHPTALAFRAYLVLRMSRLLATDATALAPNVRRAVSI